MGMDIHGILQIRESENGKWTTYDKYFRWFDNGDRNRELFDELIGSGSWFDDFGTWMALGEKIKKDYRVDSLQGLEEHGACRVLTLHEMKTMKKDYNSDTYMYRFIEELEALYDGNPKCFRIVYCFDW